jgi:medium-chain acyl-[acyl-carrier-protein] hydrolase
MAMIVTQTRTVDYAEADSAFRIKLGVLARRLQEAAVSHSESVGLGSRDLADAKNAWILNRLGIDIIRWPTYLEPLTVTTWHRGSRGFMAYRDFRLTVDDEVVAAATSRWLFFDLARKRVVKVPKASTEAYGVENPRATEMDLDAWAPPDMPGKTSPFTVTTRLSDFDPNGHVNNAVYFDYLETALAADRNREDTPRRFLIQYQKEIPRSVAAVTVGVGDGDTLRPFAVWGENGPYAAGELRYPAATGSGRHDAH